MWVHVKNGKQEIHLLVSGSRSGRDGQAGGAEHLKGLRERPDWGDRAATLPGTGNEPRSQTNPEGRGRDLNPGARLHRPVGYQATPLFPIIRAQHFCMALN